MLMCIILKTLSRAQMLRYETIVVTVILHGIKLGLLVVVTPARLYWCLWEG